MTTSIYRRDPIRFVENVPVFCSSDSYIINYEKIASDHINAVQNPFMTKAQINDSEINTRLLIKDFVKSNSCILDAGVGLGDLLKPLTEYKRYGVDVAMPYLTHAQNCGIEVAMAKLEDLPYRDELFDAVVSCDVLEHVFRLDQTSTEILRVLKPEGLLILRVPNKEDLSFYLGGCQPYDHSHVRRFDLESLRLYFEKCFGMTYVVHRYVGYQFNISSQLLFRAPRLGARIRRLVDEQIPEFEVLRKIMATSLEEIVDCLINIQSVHPEVFQVLAPELIEPIEINVIFRKN